MLAEFHRQFGATVAPDGIPLHYDDQLAEFEAAINAAVLLDRSHEGRIQLTGSGAADLLNRMSTNNVAAMQPGDVMPTIFTNPTGRIIDRITVLHRDDHLLVITQPGRNQAVSNYLQRNIFFGDDVQLADITADTAQLALHGPLAQQALSAAFPDEKMPEAGAVTAASHDDTQVTIVGLKPVSQQHLALIVPADHAEGLYRHLIDANDNTLRPAGSLTYNALRIRAGQPARAELNSNYIPLEVGLWDEISFSKGCYTGQEIIARMESRGKLARTIVSLSLEEFVEAPADIYHEGRLIGKLTSSATLPDGTVFALGIVKNAVAERGNTFEVGEKRLSATVSARAGVQPNLEK